MIRIRPSLMAMAAALVGMPLHVSAQSSSPRYEAASFTAKTTISAEGTILAVDLKTRAVTVAMSDGKTVQGQMLPAIGGLGLVKTGDKVTAQYEETLTFTLTPPGTRTPDDRVDAAMVTSQRNELPAGVVASEGSLTWVVVGADVSANTVSLINPAGGEVHTFNVISPEGRSRLGLVKSGDNLTVTFANHVFGAITRKQ